jgi:hypothetical protein
MRVTRFCKLINKAINFIKVILLIILSRYLNSNTGRPVFGNWYYLSFFLVSFEGIVPGTKCITEIFEKFLRDKNWDFAPV